jgi:hypothetical protein
MSHNAEFLLGHVRGAIQALKGGLEYKAGDESGMWGVCDQKIDERQTGKIVVVCDDVPALKELETALRRGVAATPGILTIWLQHFHLISFPTTTSQK